MTNTNTENHDLLTPDQGDPNWHEELDANRQDYDTKLPIVDTDANRTNYTAKEDALYFAYDTGKWYRGGGTNWVEKLIQGAPSDAQYLTLATDSDLSDERTLNATGSLTQTDNGADSSLDIDVADDGIGGLEIDLSDIAGENLTVDGVNDELDAGGVGGQVWGTVTTGQSSDYTLGPDELVEATSSISISLASFSTGDTAAVVAASDGITAQVGGSSTFYGNADLRLDVSAGAGVSNYGFAIVYYDGTDFGIVNRYVGQTSIIDTGTLSGESMQLLGDADDNIDDYDLSTGFDVSTATADTTFDVSGQETVPQAVAWNGDGTKIYVAGGGNTVYEYDVSTAWDSSTATYNSASFSVGTQVGGSVGDMRWGNSGAKLYVTDGGFGNETVYEYDASTAYDVTSLSYNSISFSTGSQTNNRSSGLTFNSDGTKMYVCDQSSSVYEYDLSTAWDIGSASYNNASLDTSGETSTSIWSIYLTPDETKLFVLDSGNDDIESYSLSTAGAIDTASAVNDPLSVGTEDSSPRGLTFGN